MNRKNKQGWYDEPGRHCLAAQGIETTVNELQDGTTEGREAAQKLKEMIGKSYSVGDDATEVVIGSDELQAGEINAKTNDFRIDLSSVGFFVDEADECEFQATGKYGTEYRLLPERSVVVINDVAVISGVSEDAFKKFIVEVYEKSKIGDLEEIK